MSREPASPIVEARIWNRSFIVYLGLQTIPILVTSELVTMESNATDGDRSFNQTNGGSGGC